MLGWRAALMSLLQGRMLCAASRLRQPHTCVARPCCALPAPAQLLLLFFGFIETERPSDWVLRRLGLATGQPVDAIDYQAPPALMAATVAVFVASGFGLAWSLQALLGDATWSVSTGAGAGEGRGRWCCLVVPSRRQCCNVHSC